MQLYAIFLVNYVNFFELEYRCKKNTIIIPHMSTEDHRSSKQIKWEKWAVTSFLIVDSVLHHKSQVVTVTADHNF